MSGLEWTGTLPELPRCEWGYSAPPGHGDRESWWAGQESTSRETDARPGTVGARPRVGFERQDRPKSCTHTLRPPAAGEAGLPKGHTTFLPYYLVRPRRGPVIVRYRRRTVEMPIAAWESGCRMCNAACARPMPYPWSSLHHEARLHDLRVIIHGTTDCWTRYRALSDAVKVSISGRRISASQSNKRLLPRAGSTSRSTITALETICTAIPSSGGLDRHMIRRSSCCHCQHTSEHRCRGSCAPAYCEGFVVGVVVVKWGMALLI